MISLTDLFSDNNDDLLNSEFWKKTLDDALTNEMSMDFEELVSSFGASQHYHHSIDYPASDCFDIHKEKDIDIKPIQTSCNEIDTQINIEASIQPHMMPLDATQIDLDQFLSMLEGFTPSSNQQPATSKAEPAVMTPSAVSQPTSSVMPTPLIKLTTPTTPTSPKSPTLDDVKDKVSKPIKQSNNIPRHLRESHIRAERKRQSKIKGAREELKELLGLPRASENKIVEKAVERCQSLKTELVRLDKESSRLITEKKALIADIDNFQRNLPAAGVMSLTCGTSLTGLYENHVAVRKQENSNFSIFECLMNPLFKSYLENVESATTNAQFEEGLKMWSKQNLTLLNLRPVIFDGLLNLVRNSNLTMNGPVVKSSTKRQS